MESHVLWWATIAPSTTSPRWRTSHSFGFNHATSSPHYPQSNGLAERTVKTVNSQSAGANHWSVPSSTHLQSHSLPMVWAKSCRATNGPATETDVPQVQQLLVPNWPHLEGFEQKDMQLKLQQKKNYDCRHRVRPLPPLSEDTPVWVNTQDRQIPGRIITSAATPWSYIVDTWLWLPSLWLYTTHKHSKNRDNITY